MRKLFDIEEDIRQALDNLEVDEDGCINPESFAKLEELKEERERKLENVALYYKETLIEVDALEAEAKKLSERARIAKKQADGLKMYLLSSLNGEALKTARVALSYRKSTSVSVNEEILPKKYFLKKVEVKPDKIAITEALKNGEHIEGAELVEKTNLIIK